MLVITFENRSSFVEMGGRDNNRFYVYFLNNKVTLHDSSLRGQWVIRLYINSVDMLYITTGDKLCSNGDFIQQPQQRYY